MPVVSFANPKGGAGKTTTALILATRLSESGASVTIIDAAPERWISQWASLPRKPENIAIVGGVTEDDHVAQRVDGHVDDLANLPVLAHRYHR